MEISTGTSSTFVSIVSEAMEELLLIVIAAMIWWYFQDMRKHLCNFLKKWNLMCSPMAANLVVKQFECLENEEVESEGTSSEPEPEAEVFPTQKTRQISPAPGNRRSPVVFNLPQPKSQNKISESNVTVPQGLQPQPVFFPPPGLELIGSQPQEGEKAPKRKKSTATSNSKPKPKPEPPMRELGRCVCWKDSFGFIVDETGARLFVRQPDVEGEEVLMAGQIVWFRRGAAQAKQTQRGLDVVFVDIELAKILRAVERDGIKWSTFTKAVVEDDSELLASFKFVQSSRDYKSKLAKFKAEAMGMKNKAEVTKGTKETTTGSRESGATVKVLKEAKATVAANVDGDLKAFLGSGSIEEMRSNLKYAPQWVTDKFNSQFGIAKG